MASKKPIVATDIPGTRGVLDDTTAVFTRTEDPESLASALVKTLSDSTFAEKIAFAAYNRLIEKYTWDKLAPKYRDFILKCFSG
jgi:glycosyltransferase involved in cell wall biosynthesis